MPKPKILMSEPLPHLEEDVKTLSAYADVKVASSYTEAELCKEITDADLLMIVYAKVTSRVIESAPKLRGIVRCGIGLDNIDIKAATARRIPVVNVPDYAIDTVADHAFALLLSLARRITIADKAMKAKNWGPWTSPSEEYLGVDLEGKMLGLVGLGRIGRAMARRAEGFGMNIVAFDPYVQQEQLKGTKIRLRDFEELLMESDFVSLHAALTPETKGIIGEKQLKLMKNTAHIINTSRGPLIDEKALVRALKEKWICGAGLDVYGEEPPGKDNPLLELDTVVATPHIAWYTDEARMRLERIAVDRAIELLQGKIPKSTVNRESLK
jgi:D-3-phosphoglycerate dehydrogenase